jgi:hypothetical protein
MAQTKRIVANGSRALLHPKMKERERALLIPEAPNATAQKNATTSPEDSIR